jgi:hypothetical protein
MAYYFIREATHIDDLTDVILAMLDLEHMLIHNSIDFNSVINMYNKNEQFTKYNITQQVINVVDRIVVKWSHFIDTAIIKRLRKVLFPKKSILEVKAARRHARIVINNLHPKIDVSTIPISRAYYFTTHFLTFYLIHDIDKYLDIVRRFRRTYALSRLFKYYSTKEMIKKINDTLKQMNLYDTAFDEDFKEELRHDMYPYINPDDLSLIDDK